MLIDLLKSVGTTGLVTWQGALCLYNWVSTNASWLLKEDSRVLELGAGKRLCSNNMRINHLTNPNSFRSRSFWTWIAKI